MATIDLIVLGMLKKESLSAYDIQKLVEYRNISRDTTLLTSVVSSPGSDPSQAITIGQLPVRR